VQSRLLIADEPTTALDVTIQAQILDLLRKLQQERGMALVLVTHNMGVVAEMARRVAVMYAGQVMEERGATRCSRRPAPVHRRAAGGDAGAALRASDRLATIPASFPACTTGRSAACSPALRVRDARLQRPAALRLAERPRPLPLPFGDPMREQKRARIRVRMSARPPGAQRPGQRAVSRAWGTYVAKQDLRASTTSAAACCASPRT
jgi:dipeptide transport system ATP-binding protein